MERKESKFNLSVNRILNAITDSKDVKILLRHNKVSLKAVFDDYEVIYSFKKEFFCELYFGLPAWFVRKYLDTPEIRLYLSI